MNSHDRVAALLRREIPDQMGLFEHFWPETLSEEYWVRQGYPKGEKPEHFFDYDIAMCGGWFNTEPFLKKHEEIIEETDEWKVVKDGRGASLKYWKKKSGTPEHVAFEVTTPEKWKSYKEALLADNPDRITREHMTDTRKNLEAERARGKFVVYSNLFIFELMRATLGDQTFLPALLEEPDWIRDFCQTYLDFYRKHYEIVFREAGRPDGMFIYEDFGFKKSLFCSPQTMAELVMPYEKELVGYFHDHGLPVILHSCGDITKAVPLIIAAGFDCLQPMEAKAGVNLIELAKTFGDKIAYMGNINVMALATNDPQKVQAEILPKLAAMKQMRIPYFFHSDHSIPPNIDFKTYQYALELFRNKGRY